MGRVVAFVLSAALVLLGACVVLGATARPLAPPAVALLVAGVALAGVGERIGGGRRPNVAVVIGALAAMRAAGWLAPRYDALHVAIDLVAGGLALGTIALVARRAGGRW
jgi:hypothetical protein